MAINFPASPSNGDTYSYGGKTWTYDGTAGKWEPNDPFDGVTESNGDYTFGGAVTATSFTGDGSALTNLPPSGGSITATASGALANGDLVVLRSDGKVEVVSGGKQELGSVSLFADSNGFAEACFDSTNNKVVVIWLDADDANDVYAISGSVNGTSITWDTAVEIGAVNCITSAIAFDPVQGKALAVWGTTAGGYARSIDCSGSTPVLGTTLTWNTPDTDGIQVSYDTTAGKFLVGYQDEIASNNDQAHVISLTMASNGTVTAGTAVLVDNDSAGKSVHVVYDPDTNRHLVANTHDTTVVNFQVAQMASDGVITLGTDIETPGFEFQEGGLQMAYDTVNDVIVGVGREMEHTSYNTLYSLTIFKAEIDATDNSVDIYDKRTITLHDTHFPRIAFSPDTGRFAVLNSSNYEDSVYYREVEVLTKGYNITEPVLLNSSRNGTNYAQSIVYDTNSNCFVFIERDSARNGGTGFDLGGTVYKPNTSNMTGENFVGISDGAYADGETATITVAGGTDDAQSGLTPGKKYYVQGDNTLSTTPDYYNEYAGIALSATELLVKG